MRSVRRSVKKSQRRKKWETDSISILQGQNGSIVSLKPWLNLCSRKWLRPTLSLVNNLRPWGSQASNTLFGIGLTDFIRVLRKLFKDLIAVISGLSLFHSLIQDGKKLFWKKICSTKNIRYIIMITKTNKSLRFGNNIIKVDWTFILIGFVK